MSLTTRKLTVNCSRTFMIGIQPMINLRSFHINAKWLPFIGTNRNSIRITSSSSLTSAASNDNKNERDDHRSMNEWTIAQQLSIKILMSLRESDWTILMHHRFLEEDLLFAK
jgi:hypothetical protein